MTATVLAVLLGSLLEAFFTTVLEGASLEAALLPAFLATALTPSLAGVLIVGALLIEAPFLVMPVVDQRFSQRLKSRLP
ncbi:hypothetical protein [Asaia sp. HN010]|uniref:hypothetical protein n=1 Tax=Asaia sp. HN010 TaxID=3081233 RepID=UPI003017F199